MCVRPPSFRGVAPIKQSLTLAIVLVRSSPVVVCLDHYGVLEHGGEQKPVKRHAEPQAQSMLSALAALIVSLLPLAENRSAGEPP